MIGIQEILERLDAKVISFQKGKKLIEYTDTKILDNDTKLQNDTLYILSDYSLFNSLNAQDCGCILLSEFEGILPFSEYAVISTLYNENEILQKVSTIIKDYIKLDLKRNRIYQCIHRKNSVQEITDTVSEILGNPVGVGNAEARMISMAGPAPSDLIFKEFFDTGYSSKNTILNSRREGLFYKIMKEDQPVFFHKSDKFKYPRILGKIIINGKLAGICGVSEEYKPFEWDTVLIIETMIKVLEIAIQNEYPFLIPQTREMVLTRLINEEIKDEQMLMLITNNMQWIPKKFFSMCVIGELNQQMLIDGFSGIHSMAHEICPSIYLCQYKSYLVGVSNMNDESENLRQINQLKKLALDLECYGAVSRNFTNLFEIKEYLEQLISILNTSKMINPNDYWYDFDHYNFNAITSLIPNRMTFCHPGVISLEVYDNKKNTDYIHTLKMYLVCGGSAIRTAKKLFIHRNTLYNRLEQIEKITGLDLSDGFDMFNAAISLKILEYQNSAK